MIVYPDVLPRPTLRDLTYAQVSNVAKTPMASGYTRTRRTLLNPPTHKEAVYVVHKNKAAQFEGWIKHAINDASIQFEDMIHTPLGLRKHRVKFLESPLLNRRPLSRLYWEYRAKVEIEEFATYTAEETFEWMLAPVSYADYVSDLMTSVTMYYTEPTS